MTRIASIRDRVPGHSVELHFSATLLRSLRARHADRPFTVALQLVTVGPRIVTHCCSLARQGKVHDQFLLHGLAAELTEALAKYTQDYITRTLRGHDPIASIGIVSPDKEPCPLTMTPKFRRLSPGYPVWPDLSEQKKLFLLLRPHRIGVKLTEGFQMVPEYSTSAILLPG